jgi:hypothetical protein
MPDRRFTSAFAVARNPEEAGAAAAPRSVAMTSGSAAATAATLTATLGLAAVAWVVAVMQMNGMDMGVATELGSLIDSRAHATDVRRHRWRGSRCYATRGEEQ